MPALDDAGSARGATKAGGLVLQRLPLAPSPALRDLYVRPLRGSIPERIRVEGGALLLAPRAAVSFDTYFGAFFEPAWRGGTRLRSLTLVLRAKGSLALRVLRRNAEGEAHVLHEQHLPRADGAIEVPLPAPGLPAAAGRLFAEITALGRGCRITALEWRSADTRPSEVGLVPVFCTFGREEQLGAALAGLAAEPGCWRALPRLVVVSQGRPGLAAHPAITALPETFRARLMILEQGNLGGAGGFTRGLLAAREVPGATHVVLMDDDVAVEPEALRRTAAWFAIAHPGQVLGGHMLDLIRPTQLYEAGARVDPVTWRLKPLLHCQPLRERRVLDALIRPPPVHYNGWWYFALPLTVLEEAGLPMPCFIRGDDVEYGLRLIARGIPIRGLPGAAIWHEPFYAKLHGWQDYYEFRNMLAAAARHMPRSAAGIARMMLKRLLGHLLCHRYYQAVLVLRAVEDWLRGPEAIFGAAPGPIHADLQALRRAYPMEQHPAGAPLEPQKVPPDPHGPAAMMARLLRALLRHALVRERAIPPRLLSAGDFLWFRMPGLEAVAVDSGWETELPVFRRSRPAFRHLLRQALHLYLRVLREGDAARAAWQDAFPHFTSEDVWRRYLGLPVTGPTLPLA